MSLVFYLVVLLLPFVLLSRATPPHGLGWLDRARLSDAQLALLYGAPLALVWLCALQLLPPVDRVLFSTQPQHWCTALFGDSQLVLCRYFGLFAWDDLTIFILSLAVPVWATRKIGWLPKAAPWLIAAGALFLLLEETRYLPISYLFGSGGIGASVHTQHLWLNALLGSGSVAFMILACLAHGVRAATRRPSLRSSRFAVAWERIPLPRLVHVLGALVVPGITAGLLVEANIFGFEKDKYRDFIQSMAYLGLLMVGLDVPGKVFSAAAHAPRRRLATAVVVCVPILVFGRMLVDFVDG